ncbi:unnamed protein product [Brassicogethes aeneus]|uniref:DNA-directed RNA polymerase III subunit RPC4 n=1 Tax=Brassicogethes aeneus TaxID=1431903 RepID=A0A9P0FNR8_BRAAE|nr:unnamed protein product [Brassicogethes aeneus]
MDEKLFKNLMKGEKSGGRLQSIRMPRDLNLGGTKVKKSYTPNLNVVRNKDKTKDVVKKGDQKRRERLGHDRSRQNNRQSQFVQSSGVFSEGVGTDVVHSHFREKREAEDRVAMTVPTIKKDYLEINKKMEEGVMEDIMGCDDDSDDERHFLQPITWSESDFKETPASLQLKIKTEEEASKEINKLSLKSTASEYTEDFYTDDKPNMSIWNLPDSFAGKGLSDDPKITKIFDYPLHSMLEGQVGKFIIRKSGRIQVQIGRVKYDLDSSDATPNREDIVSLIEKSKGKTNMTVLGEISNRYILNPDWNNLLI